MRLSAGLLARVIGLFDTAELNPRGAVFMPDLAQILAERFRFQIFPLKPEDFDREKGVVFTDGFYKDQVVDNLTIYKDGIKLDTRSSTENGRQILIENLTWLSKEHGLKYQDDMITRWAFVSNLAFESDLKFAYLHPALSLLAGQLSKELEAATEAKAFSLTGITLDIERAVTNPPVSSFTIERRGKTLESQHKYFSAAPLQTQAHILLLKQFEENLRQSVRNEQNG